MKQSAILAALAVATVICGCVSRKSLTDDGVESFAPLAKRLRSQISSGMPLHDLEALLECKGKMRVWGQTTGYFQFAVQPGLGVLAYCVATNNGYVLRGRNVEFFIGLPLWEGPPIRTRLSETNVLAIADALAADKLGQSGGGIPKYYPERFPEIDLDGETWGLSYRHVPTRWIGDHFTILVDDATGEAKLFGGM